MVFMALVVKYKTDAGVEGPALPSAVAITYRQEGEFPHPLPTSMRNLAAPEGDRRLGCKLTLVGVPPRRFNVNTGGNMQSILDLGADVDSRYIVIACNARSFATLRIANERKSISAWLRSVPRGSRLGMESTGSYHELLAELATKAGLQVFVINPRALRRYAQSLGRRGKTDRLDSEVIARYIAREHDQLHAYVPPTKEQRALARLIKRRAKLVEVKAALTQSLRGLTGMRQDLQATNSALEQLIARLEQRIQQTLQQIPAAPQTAERIDQIPGIGVTTSTWLTYSFMRTPYANGDAAVAATGLDPRPDDSGKKQGQRHLSKCGPALGRALLFNCARAGARMKVWRPYYQAQIAKGLSNTAATVILARKMVRVAFAVYKNNRPFNPALLGVQA
jgi:transposase